MPSRLLAIASAFLLVAAHASAATSTSTRRKADLGPRAIVELAPLKGAVGQPSLRGESRVADTLALGVLYEQTSAPGEREGYRDRTSALGVEALVYPLGRSEHPLFVGAGLSFERTDRGREAPRDAQTWTAMRADQTRDLWAEEDEALLLTQTVGYRLFGGAWTTGSLRLTRDEVASRSASVRRDDVYGDRMPLAPRGRPSVRHRIGFHLGVAVP